MRDPHLPRSAGEDGAEESSCSVRFLFLDHGNEIEYNKHTY